MAYPSLALASAALTVCNSAYCSLSDVITRAVAAGDMIREPQTDSGWLVTRHNKHHGRMV